MFFNVYKILFFLNFIMCKNYLFKNKNGMIRLKYVYIKILWVFNLFEEVVLIYEFSSNVGGCLFFVFNIG